MTLDDVIGKFATKVFLEWFFMNNEPVSIIRLFIQINDIYLNITCCEENVIIKAQKESPTIMAFQEFSYKPIEQNIEWLNQYKIVSIKYLIDSVNIKRGILFTFENAHNLVYYNEGYKFDDIETFAIDVNLKQLPYIFTDVKYLILNR